MQGARGWSRRKEVTALSHGCLSLLLCFSLKIKGTYPPRVRINKHNNTSRVHKVERCEKAKVIVAERKLFFMSFMSSTWTRAAGPGLPSHS